MKRLLYVLLISNIAVLGILLGFSREVSALTYSEAVDVRFTFNPSISVNLSAADLRINNLAPGSADDSNIITVSVASNSASGYVLSANVGNNTTYNTRNLIRSDSADNFASIAFGSSMASLTTDNTWGFSYKPSGNGTSWTNYSGLPLYSDTTNTATLISTSDAMDSKSVQFKIGAKAASTMPSGTYNNVINFILVANPEPTPAPIACSANTICYSSNALDNVDGTMGNQTSATAGSTKTLLASNFSRTGFGFAGWNTAPDYSGTSYGPNEDVTMPSDMSNGLPLYAIWVKSAGAMQSWNGCVGLNIGDVTALTDARDNDTYAVAKLADGKCWMIENLRLDSTADHNSDGSLSQGYGTSSTYGNFSGLAGSESTNFYNTTNVNSLYYCGTQEGTASIDIGASDYQGYRMPRYNNINTSSRASNPTTNTDTIYSYGNYYNWPAALANTIYYDNHNATDADGKTSETVNTSLCPTGWRLPYGRDTGNGVAPGGFYNLNYMINNNTNVTDSTASLKLRAYPNNFLYSGQFNSSSVYSNGSYGFYWSSTAASNSSSYYLFFGSTGLNPASTSSVEKSYGFSIRCLIP